MALDGLPFVAFLPKPNIGKAENAPKALPAFFSAREAVVELLCSTLSRRSQPRHQQMS
jgi:hypothetical protein